ncbi:MAG: glycoside hydrolase family 5 protein [Aestuariivirga sp.]
MISPLRVYILALAAALFFTAFPALAFDPGRGLNATAWYTWPRFKGFDKPGVVWPPFPSNRRLPRRAEFARIKTLGFDSIRLGVDPAIFIGLEDNQRFAAERLVMDSVGDAVTAGLKVVFDLHPNSRHQVYGQYAVISAENPEAFALYVAMVGDVAERLAKFPKDSVALELMNEPRLKCKGADVERWNAMLDQMIAEATRRAPVLPLVLGGACASSIEGLLALDPRRWKRDDLLYTFHFYEPFPFTHQGAPFTPWPEKYLSDLPWPPSAGADAAPILADASKRIDKLPKDQQLKAKAGATAVLAKYLTSGSGAETLKQRLEQVARWADENGVPRKAVFIGEFGVYGTTAETTGASCIDRASWVQDVRLAAGELGFAWSFFHIDGPFGLLAKPHYEPEPALLRALGLAAQGECASP